LSLLLVYLKKHESLQALERQAGHDICRIAR
jgi:hypothetical protein